MGKMTFLYLIKEYFILRKSGFFDDAFYLLHYPDVRIADVDPLWHFIRIGWKEGRNPSPFFDTTYYLESNPDIKQAGINPVIHYLEFGEKEGRRPHSYNGDINFQGIKTQNRKSVSKLQRVISKIGRFFFLKIPKKYQVRWISWLYQNFGFIFKGFPHYENWQKNHKNSFFQIQRKSFLLNLDDVQPASTVKGRIAIHIHIYYLDVVREFASLLKNMPFPYDLFISSHSKEIIDMCEYLYKDLPNLGKINLKQVENRGRNFAPLFCAFGEQLIHYDYIAHLHSKKSLYNKGATQGWREYLSDTLLGNEQQIRKIFRLLQNDELFGIVYPQNYHLLPYWANTWLANEALGRFWGSRLGIDNLPRGYFDYPAGSMFWAKVDALEPLFKAGITLDDFPEEAGQTDGTLAHALERLLVLCSLKQGLLPAIIKDKNQPSWSSWRLEQYINRPYESIIGLFNAPNIKLIAFDIFDTLIIRPLINPETIKEIVAQKYGNEVGNQYRQLRMLAEYQARKEKGKDVTLEEIYKQLGKISNFSTEILTSLKLEEESIEYSFAKPHPAGIALYHQALKTGKPVVLISDMFLSRDIVEKCLHKAGVYNWHSIYLSSEIGLRKDSGDLYNYVLNQCGLNANEMLMVGDNERSDVQIPCDMGANFIHLMRSVELARGLPRIGHIVDNVEQFQGEEKINNEIPLALVLNKNLASLSLRDFDFESIVSPEPYYQGYSIIGPLLLGFVNWLSEKAEDDNIDHFYFLAREGRLIKSVYDHWNKGRTGKPGSDYLVLSRRAASVPAITSIDDIFDIAKVEFYPDTIENFLYIRYGLKLSNDIWKRLSTELGWYPDKIITIREGNIENLSPLLNTLAEIIISRSIIERKGILNYLSKLGIQKWSNPAVVDIGYSGSMQRYLNKLLDQKIHGYYLMTSERAQEVSKMYNVILRGCYYEGIKKSSNSPILYRYSFELEKLLSFNEPQIQFYEKSEDGSVIPNYRELSKEELESARIQQSIQKGVLDFVKDASSIWVDLKERFQPSTKIACWLTEEFLNHTSQKERHILSNIVIDDYYCGRKLVH